MNRKLKPFQIIGRDFLASHKAALLADEMRLGKTDQAVTAALKVQAKKILVTCPASVKIHWQRTFELWTDKFTYQIVYGTKAKIDPNVNVVIINYELVHIYEIFKQLQAMRFGVGIFDEAHYLKGMDSRRTEAMLIRGGIMSRCTYKWPMTGTPILNRPIEIYPILRALVPTKIAPYKSRSAFSMHFCDGKWGDRGWEEKGATNVGDLRVRLNNDFMLRRTKKEVFGELDDKTFEIVPIPAKGIAKELISREFNWDKKDAQYQNGLGGGEDLAVLRHELGDYKVPFALQHIRHLLMNLDKVVVMAYHKSVLLKLKEELSKYNPVLYYGTTTNNNKDKAIKTFHTDENCRVFLGQYQAAGIGIDLSAADTIVFIESSWVPGEIDQASDRCFKFVDPEPILVQFMVIDGSLDEHMLRIIIDKKQNIDEITGDHVPSSLYN